MPWMLCVLKGLKKHFCLSFQLGGILWRWAVPVLSITKACLWRASPGHWVNIYWQHEKYVLWVTAPQDQVLQDYRQLSSWCRMDRWPQEPWGAIRKIPTGSHGSPCAALTGQQCQWVICSVPCAPTSLVDTPPTCASAQEVQSPDYLAHQIPNPASLIFNYK